MIAAEPIAPPVDITPEALPQEMAVTIASSADAAEWTRFVSASPAATGYHAWAWRDVFTKAFGHECVYLIARQGTRIAGVLPLVFIDSMIFGRSLTSLPFLNYGGVAAESSHAADALLARAADVASDRRCGHVELRHIERQFPRLPCKQHKVTMKLPLESGMWERLDRKVRNQIRKAQKSELTSEAGGIELLEDFYAVFARNMRDLGTPVYGRQFFAEVLRAFPANARIHVIRLKGAPVAAGITYTSGGTTEVPWASSIRDYNNLCPNHLLYWSVIEAAVARGDVVLDFGRSTPNEGTYKFKEQWGAAPVPLHWEYHLSAGGAVPNASPTNPKFRLAIELWKKLPLPVAARLGPPIVRCIP
jgi:FemAB-related protein (PEP-CTERM system-associated)